MSPTTHQKNGSALALLAGLLAYSLIYWIAIQAGYQLRYWDTFVAILWIANGVQFGVLTLAPLRWWPALILVSALINVAAGAWFGAGSFDWPALRQPLVGACVTLLEAAGGAALMRYWLRTCDPAASLAVLARFAIVVAFAVPVAASFVGALTVAPFAWNREFLSIWMAWALADAMGILIFGTLVLCWWSRGPEFYRSVNGVRAVELTSLLGGLAWVATVVLSGEATSPRRMFDHPYFLLPFLVWALVRFVAPILTTGLAIVAIVMAANLIAGRGPFASPGQSDLEQSLALQGALTVYSLSLLTLTALYTERRREQEIRKRLEFLVRDAQRLETAASLSAGIAHEFGNLLLALNAYVAAARTAIDRNPDRVRTALEGIGNLARQASGINQSLVTFARFAPSPMEKIDIGALMRKSEDLYRTVLSKHSFALRTPAAPIWVRGNPNQLVHCVLNLLLNARDAAPEGSEIVVRVYDLGAAGELDGGVAIEVEDRGSGIPPAIQGKIFEPFVTTKPRGRGAGLGLAVVHGIITEHNGLIRVEPAKPRGTRFSIVLPVMNCEASTNGAPRTHIATAPA